jgi:hypothetical protein
VRERPLGEDLRAHPVLEVGQHEHVLEPIYNFADGLRDR